MKLSSSWFVALAWLTQVVPAGTVVGQPVRHASPASWSELEGEWQTATSATYPSKAARDAAYENRDRLYRSRGVELWSRLAPDQRRYAWLLKTMEFRPNYRLDSVAADRQDHDEWEKLYRDKLEPEFLNAGAVTDTQRSDLLHLRLLACRSDDDDRLNSGQPVNLEEFAGLTLRYADQREASDNWINSFVGTLFHMFRDSPRAPALEREMTSFLQVSANPGMRKLMEGKSRLERLRTVPIELKLRTLSGSQLDLAAWRGKVVLIDFWATSCSSCIGEIPKLKALYAKFHGQGLEIVGISFDDASRRAKVESLLHRYSVPWPQSLQPWNGADSLRYQYGLTNLGDDFLLDQQGRLVAHDLSMGHLADEVARLLQCAPMASARTGRKPTAEASVPVE